MFKSHLSRFIVIVTMFSLAVLGVVAYADHSWGSYHWGRTTNPFTLKLGDNVSSAWDSYLGATSSDWSQSSVLDTKVVSGSTYPKTCKPKSGQVEVCSSKYGFNGWLGVASIWINSGGHITQGTVKVNDTYFNTSTYNKPSWRNLVMCQEVGHTFGLDHQDEIFGNSNLGSCMDYTNDPDGKLKNQLSNEHPNQHDYDQLGLMYAHLDSSSTVSQSVLSKVGNWINRADASEANADDLEEWGKELRKSSDKHGSLYEKHLDRGEKVYTFVIWAK